ncbi:putative Acyl-CoA N-acyltransferase with RING/FYVE/PHD-type zinc finger protein [Melia azedarach]|uniref:Acyl-CoA N-acyltransferase with RING/FYVE/PHD-type zinc finger protein n=1 Tax=Melia azedarach TaxID=155640 RepID=A0ACC1YGF5_MELAZ|nr:putative Acyl-CoA N-acyltransferase with RING/FYVE/PHD-type zinc finger protein [Melia azedarach]
MAESRRSGDQSGIVLKNRSSSGCLIVRKKSEDVNVAGSSRAQKVFASKKEKKRPRMVLSDSGSSDELLMPPRRRVGPETIRVCNGFSVSDKGVVEESEVGRKRDRDKVERIRCNEDGLFGRTDGQSDRKRNRLDVFEFDEYDGADGEMMARQKHLGDARMDIVRRRFLGSMALERGGIERDFETGSSRQVVDKRKNLYFERTSCFNQGGMNRFGMDRDSGRISIPLLREKYMGDSDEPIRLQGKNGVLKVMVNKKKKKVGDPVKNYDHMDSEENRSSSRLDDNIKRNVPIPSSSYLETEVLEKPGPFLRTEKNQLKSRKSLSTKQSKDDVSNSDDSDTALKLGPKRMEARKCAKEVSSESEKTPGGKLTLTRIKEGKVRRGSGTEKQRLRERIRGMLVDAGWTIDYRPRRNRDYLDAVYINPAGTAYWSIIKAYDALLKQLNDEEDEVKPSADGSPFAPLSDEVLSQLTRKTRKKIEKEMKKKQRDGNQSLAAREIGARRTMSARHDEDSLDSDNHEEKLSSFLKLGGKSSKSRMNENGVVNQNSRGQSSTHLLENDEKPSSGSNSHVLHGRRSRKLGRCTLLVRSSNDGPSSDTDGFVPYAGRRTLLSWLIDSGTVQLSQKVQYMNRRRTKVMLEGWITRDGIHCGCCSKILTVSKFEIHAGSKLRQPFQNIYLDSGVSLLQCQIDAWNRQEESERISYDTVDIDGDDPNDDTCGICGDGGDLICCDGCPSTFHQSCLDIQMLPPGDWHCPNCTCKFCGVGGGDITQGGDTTTCALLACSMCEKKYHKMCMQGMDAPAVNSTSSTSSFCGQKCKELFEHLQKYLGVKHDLEAGFSWSLIHRTDEDSDTSLRGLPQRVESNSKLAVALTVMDECFLPIVDRRSGINLIHNVLYNSGSNFNRLNYGGFYTAILERGDEIISAASIRFHGTQLAEMPFIGTRHIYRRQGMCRRLFCALESALCSLRVEKMVIPAISELMHTWTTVFGFTPHEESVKREMRSLNMLVFPGIDMLQKLLLGQESIKENMTASPGLNQMGQKVKQLKVKHGNTPEMASKSDIDSSTDHDSHKSAGSDSLCPNLINGVVAASDFDSKCPAVSSNSTSMLGGSSPAYVSVEGTCDDSQSGDKLVESASDGKCHSNSDMRHDVLETEIKPESDSTEADVTQSVKEGDTDFGHAFDANVAASYDIKISIPANEIVGSDLQSRDKVVESVPDQKCLFNGDRSHDAQEEDNNNSESASPVEGNTHFAAECDKDDAGDMGFTIAAAHEVKTAVSAEDTPDSQSEDNSAESAPGTDCPSIQGAGNDAIEMKIKPVPESRIEDNVQSCKETDRVDACAIDVNVAAPQEVEIVVLAEGNACTDSQSEDKLLESASDRSFVLDKNHGMLQVESKALLDSSIKDDAESCKEVDMDSPEMDVNIVTAHGVTKPVSVDGIKSADFKSRDKLVEDGVQSCRESDIEDAYALDKNIDPSHKPEIPISVAGGVADSKLGDKSAESVSKRECLVSETIRDDLQGNHQPSLDSRSEDNTPSCKVGDSGGNFVHSKAAPLGEIIAENTAEATNEIPVAPPTGLDGPDASYF